jgi:hypothetical protein
MSHRAIGLCVVRLTALLSSAVLDMLLQTHFGLTITYKMVWNELGRAVHISFVLKPNIYA